MVLNTPGKQDGCFTLDVNGERKIDLKGVYYRQGGADEGDDSEDDGGDDDDDGDEENAETLDATSANGGNASGQDVNAPGQNSNSDQGSLLGHILVASDPRSVHQPKPNVWHARGRQPVFLAPNPSFRPLAPQRRDININFDPPRPSPPSPARPAVYTLTKVLQPATITVLSHVTETIVVEATATAHPAANSEDLNVVNFAKGGKVPGFSGIFFR